MSAYGVMDGGRHPSRAALQYPGTPSHLSGDQAVNCTVVEQATAATSAGRFTRPDEVADLVVLLACSRGANVTGSDILIDGGLVQTL
jgi:NAD(P)-dependent dehydrogenase (short-subunit alcohol dehydrogenase family)